MLREAALAFALVILIAVPTATAAPAAGPPPWKIVVADQNVSLGTPITFFVYGPLNGTFNVTLTPLFFNTTVPVFFHTYTMPNGTATNKSNPSMLVSIPTRALTYGGYQLVVTNLTLHIGVGTETFYMASAQNDTVLAEELTTVWEEINITSLRELSLLYEQTQLEYQVEELFWVCVAEFIVFAFLVVVTRTGAANRRWGRVIRRWGHDLIYGRTDSDPWAGGEPPNPVPQPDIRRVWKSKLFPECDTCVTPTSYEEKVLHLRQDHRVPHPKVPRDLYKSIPDVKLAMSKLDKQEPAPAKLEDALDEIPGDAFEDLEKNVPRTALSPPKRFSFRKASATSPDIEVP